MFGYKAYKKEIFKIIDKIVLSLNYIIQSVTLFIYLKLK